MEDPNHSLPSSVSIDYLPLEQMLIVEGASATLRKHPLWLAYIRQCNGEISVSGDFFLPTEPDALSSRYQNMQRLLSRIGVEVTLSSSISSSLQRVQAEEEAFNIFSRRAAEIWEREIETEEFSDFVKHLKIACPGRTFYRKQVLAAYHLAFSQNSCNFSVPGAGKTSIVYAAYAYLKSLPRESGKHVNTLVIVGPLSSFKAWEDEFQEIFQRPPHSARLAGGVPASERADILRGIRYSARDLELILTSYQTVALGESDFRLFLEDPRRQVMLVLDEAHNVKKDDGYWANAVLRLAPLADSRVVLTGTPAPNGFEDLTNLFRFIYPERNVLGFSLPALKSMSEGRNTGAIPKLKSNIRPFYTRIKKADLNLPVVLERRIAVPLSPIHENIYRSLERRIVPSLRQSPRWGIDSASIRLKARLIRLRQAAVNPELLLKPLQDEELFAIGQDYDFNVAELEVMDAISQFAAEDHLARLSACKEIAEQILNTQGRVLIWSYFLGNIDLLRRSMLGCAPFVEVLTGATPVLDASSEDEQDTRTRESIIDRFHSTQTPAVLIANPQAVGESISLHKVCRTAIYFDRDFNCGRFIQSKDRIHRYSPTATDEVTYLYLVSPNTVDEQIDSRLEEKERRMQGLVDSDEIPLFTESYGENADDIRAILDAYEHRKSI